MRYTHFSCRASGRMFRTDSNKIKGMLGLCRRAGALCAGHDAAVESIVKNRAKLVILTSDASPGLKDEFGHAATFGGKNIPVVHFPVKMVNEFGGRQKDRLFPVKTYFAVGSEKLFGEEFNIGNQVQVGRCRQDFNVRQKRFRISQKHLDACQKRRRRAGTASLTWFEA